MKIALETCIIGLLVGLPIYLLYWRLFRPVLITRLKYRVFEARDELRLMVLRGEIGEKEKVYPILERCCNRSAARMEETDLSDFLTVHLGKQEKLEAERDLKIVVESDAHLRGIFYKIVSAMLGAACANSPGALIVLSPFVVFSVFAFWFGRAKNAFRNWLLHSWGVLYLRHV